MSPGGPRRGGPAGRLPGDGDPRALVLPNGHMRGSWGCVFLATYYIAARLRYSINYQCKSDGYGDSCPVAHCLPTKAAAMDHQQTVRRPVKRDRSAFGRDGQDGRSPPGADTGILFRAADGTLFPRTPTTWWTRTPRPPSAPSACGCHHRAPHGRGRRARHRQRGGRHRRDRKCPRPTAAPSRSWICCARADGRACPRRVGRSPERADPRRHREPLARGAARRLAAQ